MLPKKQKDYLLHWGIIVAVVYGAIFLLPGRTFEIFILGGVAFAVGLVLMALKIYPGESEPLCLDLLSGLLAFLLALGFISWGIRTRLPCCSSRSADPQSPSYRIWFI